MKRWVKKRIIYPCIAALLFALGAYRDPCSLAATGETDPLQTHLQDLEETPFVTEAVFRNGLKVLVNEHRSSSVVSIRVLTRTAEIKDPDAFPGLAGLLTSLVFRRNMQDGSGTFLQSARMLGAFLYTSVDFEHCSFEIQAPAEQWKRALNLHSKALLDSVYDSRAVSAGVRLVTQEARHRIEDPQTMAQEAVWDLGFGSPRIDMWTAVLQSNLDTVTGDALSAFHKSILTPENMLMVISGDVNAIEVLREAARLYGTATAGGEERESLHSGSPRQQGFRYRILRGDVGYPHIAFGFHTPGADAPDFQALEVLRAILGLGEGSRLSDRLRDRKNIIYEGATEEFSDSGSGYLTVQITAAPENLDRSELALLVELELLKRNAPAQEDMERARAMLERMYRDRIQTVSGRSRVLAQLEVHGGWGKIDHYIEEIRKVRASDVRQVAEKYFRLENCSLVEYVPSGMDTENRTAVSVLNTLEVLLKPATDQELVLREKEISPPYDIPERKDDFRFNWIQYPFQIASVLRGPELYIREDHTSPMIYVGLFFPGGGLQETDGNAGITNLMVRSMLQGTEKREFYRFNRQMEIYGGRLQPWVDRDYYGFYFSIPSEHFPSGFNLFMEALKTPAFDAESINWQKTLLQAERMRHMGYMERVEAELYPKLFDGFSYARNVIGTESSVKELTPEDIKNWYAEHIRNRKPLVVIIGNSSGTSLASYFVQHFSGSSYLDTEIPEVFTGIVEKKEEIQEEWANGQSIVSIGFQAPPLGDGDRTATEVLQSYLEKADSEMWRKGKPGWEISFSYEPMLRGGSFIAYAVVDPGEEAGVSDFMEKALQDSVHGPFAYVDYRSAVNTNAGLYRIRQQEPLAQIRDVVQHVLAGEGIEGFRTFQTKLQAVQEEDIQNAAERIFKMERAVSLHIYGKELSAHPPVRKKPVALENQASPDTR